jgi:hypothetical protein
MDACRNRGPKIDGIALGRLFSSAVVSQLARRGRSPAFSVLARESGILDTLRASHSIGDVLEAAFLELRRAHRNEYVFTGGVLRTRRNSASAFPLLHD